MWAQWPCPNPCRLVHPSGIALAVGSAGSRVRPPTTHTPQGVGSGGGLERMHAEVARGTQRLELKCQKLRVRPQQQAIAAAEAAYPPAHAPPSPNTHARPTHALAGPGAENVLPEQPGATQPRRAAAAAGADAGGGASYAQPAAPALHVGAGCAGACGTVRGARRRLPGPTGLPACVPIGSCGRQATGQHEGALRGAHCAPPPPPPPRHHSHTRALSPQDADVAVQISDNNLHAHLDFQRCVVRHPRSLCIPFVLMRPAACVPIRAPPPRALRACPPRPPRGQRACPARAPPPPPPLPPPQVAVHAV